MLSSTKLNDTEHACLEFGSISATPLLRLHSACFTSEILGMDNCDCSRQLHTAMEMISQQGGILIYSEWEGRGAGLSSKIEALRLERSENLSTFAAYQHQGLPPDARDFSVLANLIIQLGMTGAKLLTNNPDKMKALRNAGSAIERVPLVTPIDNSATAYRLAQRDMGHLFDD